MIKSIVLTVYHQNPQFLVCCILPLAVGPRSLHKATHYVSQRQASPIAHRYSMIYAVGLSRASSIVYLDFETAIAETKAKAHPILHLPIQVMLHKQLIASSQTSLLPEVANAACLFIGAAKSDHGITQQRQSSTS